jgi:rRNA maturation endonuclease Nob1
MQVCTSCNIEYEEDKKFCSYCGSPLKPKTESASAPKKTGPADEERPEGQLFCPHCKITYEFGNSCIQCGAPLGRQTSSQEKSEVETTRGTQSREKLPPVETSPGEKTESPRGKLICPICKIIYEHGTACVKCESALVPQTTIQTNGGTERSTGSEVDGNRLPVETVEKPFVPEVVVEAPRKKLICPSCKIIYERGTSCVRCGETLVSQTPSKEKEKTESSEIESNPPPPEPDGLGDLFGLTFHEGMEKPKSPGIEFNPPPPESDGLEDLFLWRASSEPSDTSDRSPGASPHPSSPSRPKSGVTEQGKKKEHRAALVPELSLEEEFLQAPPPDQPVAKKSADAWLQRSTFLSKLKKDYRRLGIEVGSIMIMVLAGGYLLWSVYSYLTKPTPPESRAAVSKEAAIRIPSSSASPPPPATAAVVLRESKNTEGPSPIPKAPPPATPPSLNVPKASDATTKPSGETPEVGSLRTLLENVRQSNLKKDIDLFVSCYASDFENMEERKRATAAYWDKFNYLDLSYDVRSLSISDETAKARVEWLIKTSSKDGEKPQQNKSVLDVVFKKEEGKWKIKEVKPAK